MNKNGRAHEEINELTSSAKTKRNYIRPNESYQSETNSVMDYTKTYTFVLTNEFSLYARIIMQSMFDHSHRIYAVGIFNFHSKKSKVFQRELPLFQFKRK